MLNEPGLLPPECEEYIQKFGSSVKEHIFIRETVQWMTSEKSIQVAGVDKAIILKSAVMAATLFDSTDHVRVLIAGHGSSLTPNPQTPMLTGLVPSNSMLYQWGRMGIMTFYYGSAGALCDPDRRQPTLGKPNVFLEYEQYPDAAVIAFPEHTIRTPSFLGLGARFCLGRTRMGGSKERRRVAKKFMFFVLKGVKAGPLSKYFGILRERFPALKLVLLQLSCMGYMDESLIQATVRFATDDRKKYSKENLFGNARSDALHSLQAPAKKKRHRIADIFVPTRKTEIAWKNKSYVFPNELRGYYGGGKSLSGTVVLGLGMAIVAFCAFLPTVAAAKL